MANLVGTDNTWAARGFAVSAVLLLGTINVAGVKWVIKLQFMLLLVILLAAMDFFVGSFTAETSEYIFKLVPSVCFLNKPNNAIHTNCSNIYKKLAPLSLSCLCLVQHSRSRIQRLAGRHNGKQHLGQLPRQLHMVQVLWCILPHYHRYFGWHQHEWRFKKSIS